MIKVCIKARDTSQCFQGLYMRRDVPSGRDERFEHLCIAEHLSG